MFVIFGCDKSIEPVRPLLDNYCYACAKDTTWDLYCEREWVSFFYIKTVPFSSRYLLVCEQCSDHIDLEKDEYQQIRDLQTIGRQASENLHDHLVNRLAEHQLADKNDTQLNFIRTMRKQGHDQDNRP